MQIFVFHDIYPKMDTSGLNFHSQSDYQQCFNWTENSETHKNNWFDQFEKQLDVFC